MFLRGHTKWKVMPRNVWNDAVSWQTRRLNNSTKHPLLALMTTTSKGCQTCALKCSECSHLARIERPDILWSANELARSITKWTKACDKRLNRLISHIHHTCEYRQCCHVGNTAKQCRLGLFQDSDFTGDLEHSKSTSGGTLCVLGSPTFVSIFWVQETSCCFSQFNKVGNHSFGCKIEVGLYPRT